MALFDQGAFDRALDELNENTQRSEIGPTRKQTLSRITIACLIINRTIGSGIFVSPAYVLKATGSVGISLVLWAVGGIFAFCGLMVWLEFGLSTPRHTVRGERVAVPRSGGEKNYLEYVYSKPERLATCMFGIAFLVLGNLAGNAYAFGIYVMNAAGRPDSPKGPVIGIAIAALTVAVSIHMFTRAGGIWLNNTFALIKVALLTAIIVLGIIKATGHDLGGKPDTLRNYNNSFTRHNHDPVGFADSFVYILYAYTGFEQPFYVLSEFGRPRKRFTRYTVSTVALITFLYVAVNAAYLFVVPLKEILKEETDIATLFLGRVFGSKGAQQAMSAVISVSIFGNIVVMTFTASRVKQEIAKEGILPWSLFWATGHTTPAARIGAWFRRNVLHKPIKGDPEDDLDHQEQTPMAALFLHWCSSMILIGVTAALVPYTAYKILVGLYTYVIVVIMGLFVSGGLLILKFFPSRHWSKKTHFQNMPKIIGFLPAAVYFLGCAFLIVVAFVPPESPPSYPYYIIPAIGISAPFWGVIWWGLLHLRMRLTHQKLMVTRIPYVVPDQDGQGQYIQKAELIDHEWHSALPHRRSFTPDEKGPYVEVEYRGYE